MLPGVEFARRRRTSNYSSVQEDRSMRLRSKAEHPNREIPRTSSRAASSADRCLPPINTRYRIDLPQPQDNPMHKAALEARERLEARLRAAEIRRADPLPILGLSHEDGALRLENGYLGRLQLLLARRSHAANMKIDVCSFLAKHKCGGHEECSICLEAFVVDEMLFCLPCKHKFHAECATPWIQSNGHCPYCRTRVVKSNTSGFLVP